ncbi:MAG: dihydroneopterin aldolase [Proteobacteria bacterium]|nr:dihydroneopterin aldolase [Pseudomonadota bacterium]
MDKIFLKELTTETVIGIFDWEREVKQTIAIDLEMSADIRRAARSDSIKDTLNYKAVAKRVLAFTGESRFQLVETLAEEVARLVLTEFEVDWVRVTLHKPGAIRHSKDVGVMIERSRKDLEPGPDA